MFQANVEAETVERMEWWEKPLPQMMLNQTRDSLTKADEALFKFQREYPEITLNAEGGTQAQIILALQVKENELIDLLAGAELRLATYQAELDKLSEEVISETIARNPSHSKLQDSLNEYEIERAELLGKYDETHPEVTAKDKKIKETEARLAKEEKEIKSTTSSYNPLHQVLTEKVNETQASIMSLKQQQTNVAAQIDAHHAKLGGWSDEQLRFYRLKRDVEVNNAQVVALETRMAGGRNFRPSAYRKHQGFGQSKGTRRTAETSSKTQSRFGGYGRYPARFYIRCREELLQRYIPPFRRCCASIGCAT